MKHKLFSRFISVLLAVVMLASLMSMPSLADTVDAVSGTESTAVTENDAAVDSQLDGGETVASDDDTDSTPAGDASDDTDVSDSADASDSEVPADSADGENSGTDADTTAGQKSDQSITSDSDALENIDENANENIDENTNVDSDVIGDVQEEVTDGASADATTPEGDDAGLADDAGENDIAPDNAPSMLAARVYGEQDFTISCDGPTLNVYVNGVSSNQGTSFYVTNGEALTKDQIISKANLDTYVKEGNQYYYLSSVAVNDTITDFDSIVYESWWQGFSWKSGWRYHKTVNYQDIASKITNVTITYTPYDRLGTITTADTSNTIQIDLFDYDKELINNGHNFLFGNVEGSQNFNLWSGSVIRKTDPDAPKFEAVYQDIVAPLADKVSDEASGKTLYYPQLNSSVTGSSSDSLAYLFDDTGVAGKTSRTGLNHLFRYDNGYYKYDSSRNFATLVGSEINNFIVYDKAATDKENEDVARFMPFNDVTEQNGVVNVVGSQDFYFGMHIGFDMLQPADGKVNDNQDMVFTFNGDDDLWVYIDGVLVLDLGGIHGAVDGSINFATGKVLAGSENGTGIYLDENHQNVQWQYGQAKSWGQDTTIKDLMQAADQDIQNTEFDGNTFTDWSNHRVDIFYLERGAGESNCKMEFNIQTLPTGSLTVGKTAVNVPEEQKDQSYKFQLLDNNNEPVANAAYKINAEGESITTDDQGYFTLKNGQYALFDNIDPGTYKVKEVDVGTAYNLSDFTVVTNGTVGNEATVTVDPSQATTVSVVNTAVEKGQGSLQITKSFETTDGKPAAIPSDLDHIALTIEESYNATDHEDSFNQTHTVNLTWDETEKAYVGTLPGVQYYTNFTVTDEKMLNAAGEKIENASDWTQGDFVLNRYAEANASAAFRPEKNTTEYTLPNSGYVLVKDGSDWYLIMNHVPEDATAKQEFKDMVIPKILTAVSSVSGGSKPSAENVKLLSVTEAATKYNANVQFLNSGNVLLTFEDKSVWSSFYYGSFIMTNVTMQASLSNTLNTEATIDIPVKKVWNDSKDHSGDTVTVALTNDIASYSAILSSSSSPEWSGEFEDVLKYDEDGNLIEYTASDVQEVKIAGYDSTVTGDMTNGFTVTNTPSSGYLTIYKVLEKDGGLFGGLENGKNVFTFQIKATSGEDKDKVWYAFVDGNGYATLTGEKSEEGEVRMQFAAGNYEITELSNINYTCSGATAVVDGERKKSDNGTIIVKVGGNAVTAVTYTNTVQNKGLTDGSGVINKFSSDENGVITFNRIAIAGDTDEMKNWSDDESTGEQQN